MGRVYHKRGHAVYCMAPLLWCESRAQVLVVDTITAVGWAYFGDRLESLDEARPRHARCSHSHAAPGCFISDSPHKTNRGFGGMNSPPVGRCSWAGASRTRSASAPLLSTLFGVHQPL